VLLISTMLLDTKVLHLTMLVCSTAHTFLYRWFVQLERIHSSLRSALRLVTESLRTHLPKVQQLVLVLLELTTTSTTDVLLLRTSCKKKGYISSYSKDPFTGVFFYAIIFKLNHKRRVAKRHLL